MEGLGLSYEGYVHLLMGVGGCGRVRLGNSRSAKARVLATDHRRAIRPMVKPRGEREANGRMVH